MFKLSGKRPTDLGVKDGKLALPIPSPTTLAARPASPTARITLRPFRFNGDPAAAFQRLVALVRAQPRAGVVTQDDKYLHAEFSTPLMGFVDDVEFLLAAEQRVIHVRSAARLGYADFGVNRKRVETLRAQFGG